MEVVGSGPCRGWAGLVRLRNSLDDYADLTGGALYYRNSESIEQTYSEITTQARNQYVLTYISNNSIPEGTIPFREIEIRSNPAYNIEHRFGYYQVP